MKRLVYYLKVDVMNYRMALRFGLISLLLVFVLAACKKDEPEEVNPDSTAVQQLSTDDKSVEVSTDEVLDDAGKVLSGSRDDQPCNASLDSMAIHNDTLIFYVRYHGLNCAQTRHRTGIVLLKLKLNTHWHQQGSFVVVEFINYQVRNVINNHKITIDGVSIVENVSGGTIPLIGQGISHVIHKNEAYLKVAFNGHPAQEWNITKRLIYSGQQGSLLLSIEGYGASQGHNKLLSWGIDRDGKVFFTQIEQAIVFAEECYFLAVAGRQVFHIPGEQLKATAEYGYNNDNEPIVTGECPSKYKLVWQKNGQSGTIFLPLY